MSGDRVDKKWQARGLESYSTAAILGTLSHYGVPTDEAQFKQLAEGRYPLSIAAEWSGRWTGTGQFSTFLPVAVGALWNRWLPEQLTPEAIGVPLLGALRGLVEKDDQAASKGFELLDRELPRLPTGDRRALFMRELEPWLDASQLSLEGLIDELAAGGRLPWAQRLAAASDALFPERREVVKAVLEARTGDLPAAKAALTAIARDQARPAMVRLAAVDALVPLEGGPEVFEVVAQVQAQAVSEGSAALLYALHATTHLLTPHLQGEASERARSLVEQQHAELQRLTGRAAH